MIQQVNSVTANEAFTDMIYGFRSWGVEDTSRNGDVLRCPTPIHFTLVDPTRRVLEYEHRDANPFFHVMEWVWMLAGSNDAQWLSQFNKQMLKYSKYDKLDGAYGWRWRKPHDQIAFVIDQLKNESTTRQAVVSMWDPGRDGPHYYNPDRPCNTHIYFHKGTDNRLHMTVCNRSNDVIWGMLGANLVHMTYLHELVSSLSFIPLGNYNVFTVNAHIYKDVPRYDEMMSTIHVYDHYQQTSPMPLVNGEDYWMFHKDARDLIALGTYEDSPKFLTRWFQDVAWPMYRAYIDKGDRIKWINRIKASDWRYSAKAWHVRRTVN